MAHADATNQNCRKEGFSNETYIKLQSQKIRDRIDTFGGKLYMEFGGKLFDDYHAARVLPGFAPDAKLCMLQALADEAEIVIAINAADIENNKYRGDLGITYDREVMRLIDCFRHVGLYVGSVVLTRYTGQHAADAFKKNMEHLGIKVYRHYQINNYPSDVAHIVSDEGFGRNDYIETTRSLVVVTAPGPGSGKMATCLSQLYHEHKRGVAAGYAKFETFPIWNLPLKHPVNLAYEAATADLADVNMIDPYHLEAYGQISVNYNRDIEIFRVLESMMTRIFGKCPYKSPTDMGVNMAGYAIYDDDAVSEASKQEIIRRYFKTACAHAKGKAEPEEIRKIELLMDEAEIAPEQRPVVLPARQVAQRTGRPAVAIQLPDGHTVTGKTTDLLGSSSAALLNALKYLADIPDEIKLISPEVIEPIMHLKTHLGSRNPRMHTDELLIALSICAVTDAYAARAMEELDRVRGSEIHSTVILAHADEKLFGKLGAHVTSDPLFEEKKLYHGA
ncbi:MAG: DUF1846 domain-containing protein [Clostridia bacterium]|nr:DUF1846 domain-containing protein [Clostridia bacterium]MBQ7316945.1 DUF1846 domain-containing protein [Clostridia bacterium]